MLKYDTCIHNNIILNNENTNNKIGTDFSLIIYVWKPSHKLLAKLLLNKLMIKK